MMSHNPNTALSQLKRALRDALAEYQKLAWQIAETQPMIPGSFYEVYKTCSKPNCRCQKGHKHGPFPALSQSIAGKRRLIMVRKSDSRNVQAKADAYKRFQKRLSRLRKLTTSIDTILTRIRALQQEKYP
jgi:hypothetical protein